MSEHEDQLRLERELFVRAFMPDLHGAGAARLASTLEARDVPGDTFLFRQGDPPDEYFFIIEGHVVLEAEDLPSWAFGDRSLVGMVDMTAWRPHRRDCRTTRPTRLLVGRSAEWRDLLDDDPFMGEGAIHSFTLRLHELWSERGHLLPADPIGPAASLSSPLAMYEKALVLRDTHLLARAHTQAIASLAQVAEELSFEAGDVLFTTGNAERALYVVASGVVTLRSSSDRVTRVGPSRFLAPAAALSGQLGAFSASAESDVIVLRIREEDYYDQAEEHPELTRSVMAYAATEMERLMDLNPPVA
jgi:CRP-like cAMP-binding protein